ncbi:hypothetical protein [Helicobacter brantae]|uniref:Uncharacterized protein n=1 Tax=Helicobacter brantae TaxID=375927 RepID=A0A3D8J3K2_9HELI|nr:hypothetical protein [Helicobacter brantae]RDU71806.1 hypothetical protein CQA58_01830 [Helicobacter brantae]
MFDSIIRAWRWIKKIVLTIIRFVDNIVSWFENPNRLRELQEDMDNIAVAVKEKLENGDCGLIKCLFNTREGEIVGREESSNPYAEGMISDSLDEETKRVFGNKDMIVLE